MQYDDGGFIIETRHVHSSRIDIVTVRQSQEAPTENVSSGSIVKVRRVHVLNEYSIMNII